VGWPDVPAGGSNDARFGIDGGGYGVQRISDPGEQAVVTNFREGALVPLEGVVVGSVGELQFERIGDRITGSYRAPGGTRWREVHHRDIPDLPNEFHVKLALWIDGDHENGRQVRLDGFTISRGRCR
jgi:hypothetical protein